jgi:hypothetical protein
MDASTTPDDTDTRLMLVNTRYLLFASAIVLAVGNVVLGWILYNTQEDLLLRNRRRIRSSALGLAVANAVVACLALVLTLSRMLTAPMAGVYTRTGTASMLLTALLIGANAALLFVIHANYRVPKPGGTFGGNRRAVQNAVTGVVAFSMLFILVVFVLLLAGSAQNL